MIISKKKYEEAVRKAVDKEVGAFWRDREMADQRESFRRDLSRMHDELDALRSEIARTAADLSKRLGGHAACDKVP